MLIKNKELRAGQPNWCQVQGKVFFPLSSGEENVREVEGLLSVAWTNDMVHDCMCGAL